MLPSLDLGSAQLACSAQAHPQVPEGVGSQRYDCTFRFRFLLSNLSLTCRPSQLHGRSRQQRYKTKADYTCSSFSFPVYNLANALLQTDIAECARVLRETAADEGLAPIPIFGNGDAYDYRTYYENVEATGVDGIMLARGALIKVRFSLPSRRRRADHLPLIAMALHRNQRAPRLGYLLQRAVGHGGQARRLRLGALGIRPSRREPRPPLRVRVPLVHASLYSCGVAGEASGGYE